MFVNDKNFTVDMYVEFLPAHEVIGCKLYEKDDSDFYKYCRTNHYKYLDDAVSAFLKLYSVHPYALLCIEFFYNGAYIGGDTIRYVHELDNMAFALARQLENSAVKNLEELGERERFVEKYKDFLEDFIELDSKEQEKIVEYVRSKRSVPA